MKARPSDKAVARLLAEFESLGWRVTRGGKHYHCYAPRGGAIIIVPTTPSDPRSLLNCRSLMRRAQTEKENAEKSR